MKQPPTPEFIYFFMRCIVNICNRVVANEANKLCLHFEKGASET
jgi:hypothetical protein